MALIFDKIGQGVKSTRQGAGNFVDAVGSVFAPWAPDTRFSEFIAGGPTLNTQARADTGNGSTQTPVGPSTPVPNRSEVPYGPQPNPNPNPNPTQNDTRPTNTSTQNVPGDSRFTQLEKMNRNPVQEQEYQALLSQMGPSNDQIRSQINSIFDDVNSYLNRAEGNLRQDFPTILGELGDQFNVSRGQLETGRDQTGRMLDESENQSRSRRQDAESANARLFNELQRGALQRFGGASSAGQAATELANVEAQRRQGAVAQDFNTAMREIETQRLRTEEQFQQGLQQLTMQKQMAENEARRSFQNKLLEIDKMRADASQNKGAMKLQALMDLRNQVNAISMQNMQFQQQLQMMREQANIELQSRAAQFTQAGNTGVSAFNQFAGQQNLTPASQFSVGAQNPAQSQTPQMTGRVNDDEIMGIMAQNRIPGSSATDPRFANYLGQ